jgi:hypothetical protein
MYAITANSFRAIDDPSEAQAGETVVDSVPDTLLKAIAVLELRRQRDNLLCISDWTQGSDSPLSAAAKAAWATYREALRNVPQQDGFPATVTWPTAP